MHKRNGLALLVSLMVLAVLVAAVLSLSTWVILEIRQQESVQRGRALRLAAVNAVGLGMAATQAQLGPDIAHTFESSPGLLTVGGKREWVRLKGEVQDGPTAISWEVEDLSLAYDVAARAIAAGQASSWARTSAGRAKLPYALAEEVTPAQVVALAVGGREFFEGSAASGTAWQVRGLLTDAVRGGWRKDLADREVLAAEIGGPIAEALGSPAFSQPPGKGYPLARLSADTKSLDTLPILTDFRLSLGFFNARSDGRHRLRFHGSVVFWNCLSVPVLAGPQGKLFLVEIVGSPEVTITNLETHSSFATNLDDCPQEDFGVIRQGLRERGLWFWAEVSDPETMGLARRGLLPGEVYALVSPAPTSQPQGLARILTRQTWKMERRQHGPGWRRPGPTTFLPTDRIEITVRFRDKVGIRLRPYAGEPLRDIAVADYPAPPVIALENIVLPDFSIQTTGEDYSREDSAGYVIEERRACLRVRLRPREESEGWVDAGAFSKSRWDFAHPQDAAEWKVAHPVMAALDVADQDASPLAGPLWDLRVNRHDAAEAGAFAAVRLRDFPGWPCLSVGALRHLEPKLPAAWPANLDRLFASAPLLKSELGVVAHNPFLVASGLGVPTVDAEVARGLQIVGPFNVNSRNAKAWEAFLGGSTGRWQADKGGPFAPSELQGPLFFTQPQGATLAKGGALSSVDVEDQAAMRLPGSVLTALAGQQGVRSVDKRKLTELAQRIVELQPSQGWPFPSLESFARSQLLSRALEESGINSPFAAVAPELPIHLKAEDLLESWAPILAVRGDTFKVTGQAVGLGGSSVCEIIIQRVAEEHPTGHLGRKFRIISVRFRNR